MKGVSRRQTLKRIGIGGTGALVGLAGCTGQDGDGGGDGDSGDSGGSTDGDVTTTMSQKTEEPDEYTLQLAHTANQNNPLFPAYDRLGNLANQKSDGRLNVQVYCCGKLAGDVGIAEALQTETIDIGSVASNNLAGLTDAFKFGDLPYIWKSLESSREVWDGDIGEQQAQRAQEDLGLKPLAYMNTGGGFRKFATTNKKVKVPADSEGIKVRVTQTPVEQALVESWGANPTPIAWAETYQALQDGVVNGEHLHFVWLYFANHYEPMNYIVETDAMANVHVTLMNENSWNQLPEDLQDVLMEAAQEAEEYNNSLDAQAGANAAQQMEDSGIEIYTPSDEEFQQWKELGVEIWPEFIGDDGISRQLVQDVLDAQNYSVPVEF